jgi:hypothetical protein
LPNIQRFKEAIATASGKDLLPGQSADVDS